MEPIGDSLLVDAHKNETTAQSQNEIEFERNLDEFKKTLESEEGRLQSLVQTQAKIKTEIEQLFMEIRDEKKKYRLAMDVVIAEREKISQAALEGLGDLGATSSNLSLLESCRESIENSKTQNCNIDIDIEKIRCDLLDNYVVTKEDYLKTIKDYLDQTKKKIEAEES